MIQLANGWLARERVQSQTLDSFNAMSQLVLLDWGSGWGGEWEGVDTVESIVQLETGESRGSRPSKISRTVS